MDEGEWRCLGRECARSFASDQRPRKQSSLPHFNINTPVSSAFLMRSWLHNGFITAQGVCVVSRTQIAAETVLVTIPKVTLNPNSFAEVTERDVHSAHMQLREATRARTNHRRSCACRCILVRTQSREKQPICAVLQLAARKRGCAIVVDAERSRTASRHASSRVRALRFGLASFGL